jgi:hypothetical protein
MLDVILRIEAIHRYRIMVPGHFPDDGRQMIDVIECANEKKVHVLPEGFE